MRSPTWFILSFMIGALGCAEQEPAQPPPSSPMRSAGQEGTTTKAGGFAALLREFDEAELKKHEKEADLDKETEQNLGMPISNIVTASMGVDAKGDGAVVLRTKEAIDAKALMSKMKKRDFRFENGKLIDELVARKFKEEKIGDHTIYIEDGKYTDSAFFVPESHVPVLGKDETIRSIAKRNKEVELSEGLQEVLKQVDQSRTFFVAVNIKELPRDSGPLRGIPVDADLLVAGGIDGTVGKGAEVTGTLTCKDADSAAKLQKEIDKFLTMAKEKVSALPVPEIKTALDSVKVSASGANLSVKASLQPAAALGLVTGMGQKAEKTFETVGEKIGGGDPEK